MALKKTVMSNFGFEVIDAYHRVAAVTVVNKNTMQFYVRSHVDVDHPFFAEQVLTANYTLDGGNPIAQAYAHLKTLPEFTGATDC